MLIQTILANAKYWSLAPQWNSGFSIDDPDGPQVVTQTTKEQIEGIVTTLWNNGVGLGAQLLRESRTKGPLRFAEIKEFDSVKIGSPDPWIGFNPAYNAVSYFRLDVRHRYATMTV